MDTSFTSPTLIEQVLAGQTNDGQNTSGNYVHKTYKFGPHWLEKNIY